MIFKEWVMLFFLSLLIWIKAIYRMPLLTHDYLVSGFPKYSPQIWTKSCKLDLISLWFIFDIKILVLTLKVMNGVVLSYLAELLNHYSPVRSLRSTDKTLFTIPWSRLKTKGDRSFAVRTPTNFWISLHEEFRLENPLLSFKSPL